jgi:hypothetical protein
MSFNDIPTPFKILLPVLGITAAFAFITPLRDFAVSRLSVPWEKPTEAQLLEAGVTLNELRIKNAQTASAASLAAAQAFKEFNSTVQSCAVQYQDGEKDLQKKGLEEAQTKLALGQLKIAFNDCVQYTPGKTPNSSTFPSKPPEKNSKN